MTEYEYNLEVTEKIYERVYSELKDGMQKFASRRITQSLIYEIEETCNAVLDKLINTGEIPEFFGNFEVTKDSPTSFHILHKKPKFHEQILAEKYIENLIKRWQEEDKLKPKIDCRHCGCNCRS